MLEIVFSSSACGSLKAAQRYGEGEYPYTSFGFIGHSDGHEPTPEERDALLREFEEKDRADWARATPMGGKSTDVYGFQLILSIGDISEDEPGERRLQQLERLYGVFPRDDGRTMARRDLDRARRDLAQLRARIDAGEPLRIWHSDQPDEACGLCWFLSLLHHWDLTDARTSIVKLPAWDIDEDDTNIRRLGSWGEIRSGDWHRFLSHEAPASPLLIREYAHLWHDLQAENAPLRATLNGQLVSAPCTLYDDEIRRCIDRVAQGGEPFHEVFVIGRMLERHLGVGDAWIASRIDAMIEDGALEIVSEAAEDGPTYARTLRRCTP